MTPLAARLRQRIVAEGPLTVAEYMAAALTDPAAGYYATRDPIGRDGDFITAPEVSQLFGELIGLWCAAVWQTAGCPDPVLVVELGPGRGTLASDALRAIGQAAPGMMAALRLHLVEASPSLQVRQRETLGDVLPSARISWHDRFEAVPAGPMLLIANEFFDALPIRQVVRRGDGWRERRIGLSAADDDFAFVESALEARVEEAWNLAAEGEIVELCPEGEALAAAIGRRVGAQGGAALIIDYGPSRSAPGDSLQAVSRHHFANPLDRPGEVDLTHHVDFAALARSGRTAGAAVFGPLPQGLFLGRLGIEARAEALRLTAAPGDADAIPGQVRRLVHPGRMGLLFKALAVAHADLPCPPGFRPCH